MAKSLNEYNAIIGYVLQTSHTNVHVLQTSHTNVHVVEIYILTYCYEIRIQKLCKTIEYNKNTWTNLKLNKLTSHR